VRDTGWSALVFIMHIADATTFAPVIPPCVRNAAGDRPYFQRGDLGEPILSICSREQDILQPQPWTRGTDNKWGRWRMEAEADVCRIDSVKHISIGHKTANMR
jgi:hypothetical protein